MFGVAKATALNSEKQHARTLEFLKWEAHSSTTRSHHQIARASKPWTSRRHVQLKGVPDSARIRDVIDVGFAIRQKSNHHSVSTKDLIRDLFADVATSVHRLPYKQRGLGVFRQNSLIYSYDADVLLSGMSHMQLMGWPKSALSSGFSDADLRHLAGEYYSLPICTMITFCLYCNPWGSWWSQA